MGKVDSAAKDSLSMKKTKDKSPKDSFEETARRLECDDDKKAFEKKLGKIAKAPVKRATRK
jgi:hypothetical protein